jgi:periplasmic mercuric ion binding protein
MKKIISFMLIVGFPLFIHAEEVKVSVKGMVCGFCAQGITKKFKARSEIDSVDVSLEKKLVLLTTKTGAALSDQAITEILTDAGYNIEKIERK